LKQIINQNGELNTQILDFCRHIAGTSNITALAHVDNYSMKSIDDKTIIDIMLVIQPFQPRIMSYIKTLNEKTIFVFAIDQWVFERDIEIGLLGEAFASKLIFPHSSLCGEDYLHKKEVSLKKRLVLESLENLASSFPELTHRIQIKPEYFLYEVLSSRIRVFPLIAYDVSSLMKGVALNEAEFLRPYNEALRQLESEEKIFFLNDYVKISEKVLKQCLDPRVKIVNLSRNVPRRLFQSIFGTFPQLISIFSQNTEAFLKAQKNNWVRQADQPYFFIDPQKYVFFQTSTGLLSLADKIDIKGFVQKMFLTPSEDIEVEPLGGILNDVYLINARGKGTKILAKRFKDWSGFKWFPLTVWSLGARPFAITAQARLAKEYSISEFLYSEGFHVPKILHVSNAERLIFMEYIEGENLSQSIKHIAAATEEETFEKELVNLGKAGEILAKVHSHDIVLGDSKPENMLVKPDGTIFMIDFEQASQDEDGDRAWDVAVFLYYAGHYIQPLNRNNKAELIAKAFINGYLKAGGKIEDVKKAGLPKYTRVFGIFTMWNIISIIANVCKKTEPLK
jgi:Kae1-associated kinase Bud32